MQIDRDKINVTTPQIAQSRAEGASSNAELAPKTCNGVLSRYFALGQEGNATEVHMAEFTDGCMGIALRTKRGEGMEPLNTEIYLTAKTFGLLFDAMFRAAHDSADWQSANERNSGAAEGGPAGMEG